MEFKALGSISPSLFSSIHEKIPNLLDWYQANKRDLPWRSQPDIYRIWISEVMSQQTTLKVVVPKYLEFIDKLPDVHALASAEEVVLRELWSGMGYYARCRNLQKGARYIIDNYQNSFPSSYEEWLNVPGVGPYTASMVVSTGLNLPFAAVDGNIIRVLSRLFLFGEEIWTPKGQDELQKVSQALLERQFPGDYNQGLMELGATVCHKKAKPNCEVCPFQESCSAHKNSLTSKYPPLKPKKEYKNVNLSVLVLQDMDSEKYFLLERKKGFLKKTTGFPLFEKSLEGWFKENRENGCHSHHFKHAFKHTITNHKIIADVYYLSGVSKQFNLSELEICHSEFLPVDDIQKSLSSSLDKKALKASLQSLPLF